MTREVKYKDPNCYNEAVIAYRDQFELMPNRGFRQDIAVTIKTYDDLCIWQDLLARWGYTDRTTGKWKARNPLDIKSLLTVFEMKQREAQRKKDEIQRQNDLQERSRARVQFRSNRPLPALRRSTNGWKG